MLIWLTRKLFGKRAKKPSATEPDPTPTPAPTPVGKSEWVRPLITPIEQSCMAPSEDAIVYSYLRYRDPIYAPFLERQHQLANLRIEISSEISELNAHVPVQIERVMSMHPYEFSHFLEQKEPR